MTLNELLKEKLILVVINGSTNPNSTDEEIKDMTLNAWAMDFKRASNADYIVGLRHGIGVSCYKIEGCGIRKCDGRVFFSTRDKDGSHMDLSHLVKDIDFKKMELRQGYNPFQYINC